MGWSLIPVCRIQANIGRNINSCILTNVILYPTHSRIKVDKMAFAISNWLYLKLHTSQELEVRSVYHF